MKIQGDKIVISKDEYVTDILLISIAVKILVRKSKFSMQQWMAFLCEEAEKQLKEVKRENPKELDQMIKVYANASNLSNS